MIAGLVAGAIGLAQGAWRIARELASSKAGRVVLAVLLLTIAAVILWRVAYERGVAGEKAAEAGRRQSAVKVIDHVTTAGKAITADVAANLEAGKVEIRTRTQTLIKEVPVYVTVESDRACLVPVGFVRVHDAAAHGAAVPGSADGSVEAASGVALSAVAETVAFNYGVAYEWRAEALAWRAWHVRHADLWNKNIKAPDPEP